MIIYIHSSLPVGGAEVLRRAVCRELADEDISFRVCLLTKKGKIGEDLINEGYDVDILNTSKSIYQPFTILALARYLRLHQPEIIQSSQFNSNFHTRIAAKVAGVPITLTEEHGLYYWKKWWHRLIDRVLASFTTKIIAASAAVKAFNVDRIGLRESKIRIILNCLDMKQFSELSPVPSETLKKDFGITDADFVFGHVGTLRMEKGHDVLLKAMTMFERSSNAKLLLVGSGPLEKNLKRMCVDLGLKDRVVFAGNRADIPELLNLMDCFVFPSRNEALGIALLEAMYAKLPVIASNVGGIPEIVTDGETGLLIEPENIDQLYDSMKRLLDDPSERACLGQAARDYVLNNHSPDIYVDSLLALYQELQAGREA